MHPEKHEPRWLPCLWAAPSVAVFFMLAIANPVLAQDQEGDSAPDQEVTDARPVQQELTDNPFVRKSEADQRAALIQAIDSYEGVAAKPVVHVEGTYWVMKDLDGLDGYDAPKVASEEAKFITDFFCLLDSKRARWTAESLDYDDGGRARVDKFEIGFDGRELIRLDYGNATKPVRATIARPPSRQGDRLTPLLYDGLHLALGSFGHPAASKVDRVSMQMFLLGADAINVEDREGESLVVHVRKTVDDRFKGVTTEYIRTFRVEPVVHCVRSSLEWDGPGGGSAITVDIDYDWRDGSWLPVQSTRTAVSTPLDDDGRQIVKRTGATFTKLEFLDAAPDEEFLPKIPEGVQVTKGSIRFKLRRGAATKATTGRLFDYLRIFRNLFVGIFGHENSPCPHFEKLKVVSLMLAQRGQSVFSARQRTGGVRF